MDTNLLRLEHIRIASMADDLAAMVDQPRLKDPARLGTYLEEFGRTLAAHLAREDWAVYPCLLTDKRPGVRALAGKLLDDALAFTTAFRCYCRDWTTESISADWPGFREATLLILAQLRLRVEVEDRDLYPLVAFAKPAPPLRHAG